MSVKKQPRVSYILGIYNAERTLEECLSSIFMQSYPQSDYEVVIIDGGSQDRTLEIVHTFMKKYKNIRLLHNPKRLSEGRGMSKDMGVDTAAGEIVIFLDHDNILLQKDWLTKMLEPFDNKQVMASQSLLAYTKEDNYFLRYINHVGVEDPFAISYSLVAQVTLNPERFPTEGSHFLHTLDSKNVLFGGANGCAFRKKVFPSIGGYTRDVDVFACMADQKMLVAVPKDPRVHHKTSNGLWSFLRKKGVYYYRFVNNDYQGKKFSWIPKEFRGKVAFLLMVAYNLSIIGPTLYALRRLMKDKEVFWIIHPLFLFFITVEYLLISLAKLPNTLSYAIKR